MPLDAAFSPRNVTATLHYQVRTARKPVCYVDQPPPGEATWNGIDDPREVRIEDARGRESEFTLDRNGFAFAKAPTAVADFYDEQGSGASTTRKCNNCCAEPSVPVACSSSTTTCAMRRERGWPRRRGRYTMITR